MLLLNQYGTSTILSGIKALRCSKRETLTFIKEQVSKVCIPQLNLRYRQHQAEIWLCVFQAGKASLKLSPLERPSSKILQDILHMCILSIIFKSGNSTGTISRKLLR